MCMYMYIYIYIYTYIHIYIHIQHIYIYIYIVADTVHDHGERREDGEGVDEAPGRLPQQVEVDVACMLNLLLLF